MYDDTAFFPLADGEESNFKNDIGLKPEDKIHFIPFMDPTGLRNLFTAADAVMNLTLLHDENFGLAQVEAMGCGTPVMYQKLIGPYSGSSDANANDKVSCRPTARFVSRLRSSSPTTAR